MESAIEYETIANDFGANIRLSEYVDVREIARKLGADLEGDIILLPSNLDTAKSVEEYTFSSETSTVRKLLEQQGVAASQPISISTQNLICLHSQDWYGPVIFLSAYVTQQGVLLQVALNIISDYISRIIFNDNRAANKARLEIVLEKPNGGFRKVSYVGSAEGLKQLPRIIKELHDDH